MIRSIILFLVGYVTSDILLKNGIFPNRVLYWITLLGVAIVAIGLLNFTGVPN